MPLLEAQEAFMLTSTLRNVGGSVMMAIPKSLLEGLGLSANAKVALSVDHGRLVVEPNPKPKYTLAELLAQCNPDAPISAEEQEWQEMEPVGQERL
jgi:antitoxin ChpS